jgi:1-acyl-sn-glycerol-3-phosphate acyltransferase
VRALRVLLRAPLFACWTVGLWCLWLLGLPVAAARGRRLAWRHWIFHTWGRGGCPLLGVHVTTTGRPPSGAYLLASNHLSYLDVLVLAGRLRCAFVSKAEVAAWPVVGAMARTMGTLFVDRERKRGLAPLVATMRERLQAGEGLVLFPEGTSTRGAEVLRFRASLLEPAAAGKLAVHACALRYETPTDGPPAWSAVAWWGDMSFLPHFLGLCALRRIDARIAFAEHPVMADDRKALAGALEQAVRGVFDPLASTSDPREAPRLRSPLETATPTR